MATIDQYYQPVRYPDQSLSRIFYTRTIAPTTEPLTLDDAVRHLQLSVCGDTAYVINLIQVARDVAENATGLVLSPATWRGVFESWPQCGRRVSLSMSPITAVSSVKYYPEDGGALVTVSAADYTVSTDVTPAVITFGEDFTSPALANRPDAIQVNFTAGYASATVVPPSVKHALRILVRHYYDHPEAVASGSFEELPFGLRHLLTSNRVYGWTA